MKITCNGTLDASSKKCSSCNANFDCENSIFCWCMTLEPLSKQKIKEDEDCLCKDCLLKNYKKKLHLD